VAPAGGPRVLRIVSSCPKHGTPAPKMLAVRPLQDSEAHTADGGDGSVNGLWNAQPYKPWPAVPLPRASSGCARAEPLELERISHGTGNGYTTLKGFWIPDAPPPLPPAHADPAEVSEQLAPSSGGGRGGGRGRGRGRG
ncbi:hypothetical protein Vretifemale_1360, partial [Volvox reticuliferus]